MINESEMRIGSIYSWKGTLLDAIYFWFSFISLVARTFAMTITAANLHLETKRPLKAFKSLGKWCDEVRFAVASHAVQFTNSISQVKRFNGEVSSDMVALTGLRFFFITRKLMLSVAAKVITYEIFLIQLQMNNQSDDSKEDFCNV